MKFQLLPFTATRVGKWLARIGVAVLAALAVIGWSIAINSIAENHDLTASARRRSPVTDYQTAWNAHQDCIKAWEIQFFAHIDDALLASTDGRATAQAALGADRVALRSVFTDLCPSPTPPEFDPTSGALVSPAVVPPLRLPPPP